jgi:hypothetical protein
MTEDEKWKFILDLDNELLQGGVILSEWSAFLIKDADLAFVHSAHLACIVTAIAGIESHLKYEAGEESQQRLVDLIDHAGIEDDLKSELHELRRYRNQWVHVRKPQDDQALLDRPEDHEAELEKMARRAMRALRRVIYSWQWV